MNRNRKFFNLIANFIDPFVSEKTKFALEKLTWL